MLDNMNDDDSMEDGQRINHRHYRNLQEPNQPNHGNNGLRNLNLNNPFGRTFVIINDMEDGHNEHLGYINHFSHFFE
jgi:hypothetical protein